VVLPVCLAVWVGVAPDAGRPAPAPAAVKKLKVVVDPGHGVVGNGGNHGLDCQSEAEFTLKVGRKLAESLSATGRFEVLLSRDQNLPSYDERIAAAVKWKADVIVSLHSDARGEAAVLRTLPDGGVCARNDAEPGTAVLYSDEGPPPLVDARARLCRAFGRTLKGHGFPTYSGVNYGGLYTVDAQESGCWRDVHVRGKRIYFLRQTPMPTVIIETHHALDRAEVDRWSQSATLEAFGAAVVAGLDAWRSAASDGRR
jgi:N-acetylmuramoyl-L-alanine amidase